MVLTLTNWLASLIGAPEPAFRLLLSIISVYPMAWFYRARLVQHHAKVQTFFFVIAGLLLGFFNFGLSIVHSLIAISFTYATFVSLGPTSRMVIANFAFHMTYLITGYFTTCTETYDIKWTMPHCVLTLRLIGLCFDYWDGSKAEEQLSASNKLTALKQQPTYMEIAGHVYFPACFLVGPQFSMRRLIDFTNGKFERMHNPSCIEAGIRRAIYGLIYLALYQCGILYVPDNYFLTQDYADSSFIKKHFIMGMWGKIMLCKYVSCWLLTEGACITFGIAYNGTNKENGESLWNGCRNIDIPVFEGGTKFGHYIESFNINTNHWAAQYIYKRCAFLGNKFLSQIITLSFLALWHGIHSGYYMTFFLEFVVVLMEKDLENIILRSKMYDTLHDNILFKIVSFIVCKIYAVVFMGYCLIPFSHITFNRWWSIYKSVYFSGYILFFPWMFLYKPIVKMILRPSKTKAT